MSGEEQVLPEKGPILIVDDEENIREVVKLYLTKEGYPVETAGDGEEALLKIDACRPQLIVLDLMLPKKDGWEVCREVRRKCTTPIIMLTAKGEEIDRILGLEMGADDYLCKPFSPRELVARIRAVLRRTGGETGAAAAAESKVLTFPCLTIDYTSHKVLVNGWEVELTPREFDLLWFLASNEKRLFTREQLLENVWDYEYAGDTRTLNTHIKRLREKLGECSRYIITVWGIGYKFEVTT